MINNNIKYDWDEELGIATCTIKVDGGKTFTGRSYCSDKDLDVKSEYTGCTIAYYRAILNSLLDERDNILLPGLKALKQLYYSINKSKNYNRYSYEAKMLYNQIQHYEDDLKFIRNYINDIKADLTRYINDKEYFAINLRKIRNDGQKEVINSKENS